MLEYRSSSGAVIAWRQSEQEPIPAGTVKPRRRWLLYYSGRAVYPWARVSAGAAPTFNPAWAIARNSAIVGAGVH